MATLLTPEGEYLLDAVAYDINKLDFLNDDTTPATEDARPNLSLSDINPQPLLMPATSEPLASHKSSQVTKPSRVAFESEEYQSRESAIKSTSSDNSEEHADEVISDNSSKILEVMLSKFLSEPLLVLLQLEPWQH